MSDYLAGLEILPEHMRDGVQRYIEKGIPGGSFQEAVFSNQLLQAFSHADFENIRAMKQWVEFIYNYAPNACHGSPAIVNNWIEHNGLLGLDNA